MSNNVNWSELLAKLPKSAETEKPLGGKYAVSTWTDHKCSVNHRTAEAFLKCASSWTHNGEKLTKNNRYFSGFGQWVVMHSHYSGDYYTKHNNKYLNHGHVIENVYMFKTYEQASQYITGRIYEDCFEGECTGPCRGLNTKIIHIKL